MITVKDKFQYILNNYLGTAKIVNKENESFQILTHTLPSEIREFINDDKLIVKGSMGQTNKSDCPWISILNSDITRTTQSGIYIVYLFKKDMTGFYLSLNQGIKNFQDLFQSKKYEYAVKVAKYFKDEIPETTFSKGEIHLGDVKPGQRAFGYEKTTVLSKYYPINNYDDKILKNDLSELIKIYNMISKHFNTSSYNEVIKQILAVDLPVKIDGDKAISEIKHYIDPEDETPYGFRRKLKEQKPFIDLTRNFKRLTSPTFGKIDYIKKANRDMKTGLVGEALVIDYEKERLISIGREDLECQVKWVSREDDGYGYDIESFDIDENGNAFPIKIEVKATSSRLDVEFFISKNEIDASKKYKKNYCIYRLYDVYSENPKFYRAFGEVSDNFILDPVTFMARYKYPEIIS